MKVPSKRQLKFISPNHYSSYTVKQGEKVVGRFDTWEEAWEAADRGEIVFSEMTQTGQQKVG